MFTGMKFCIKFALSYLDIIVKDQLFTIRESQVLVFQAQNVYGTFEKEAPDL